MKYRTSVRTPFNRDSASSEDNESLKRNSSRRARLNPFHTIVEPRFAPYYSLINWIRWPTSVLNYVWMSSKDATRAIV